MAVLFQLCNGLEPVGVSRLQHRQSTAGGCSWPRCGMGGWGEVVGVGFSVHLEHGHGDRFGKLGPCCEPFRSCPTIDHLLGEAIADGQVHHFIEGVLDQQRAAQALGCIYG